jgi:hypothetical protein
MDLKTIKIALLKNYKAVKEKINRICKSKLFGKTISVIVFSGKILLFTLFLWFVLFVLPPALQEFTIGFLHSEKTIHTVDEKQLTKKLAQLEEAHKLLNRKLEQKTPQQPYLIVNSTQNTFSLMKGKKVIREGICSTGSYIMLKAADERKWIFKTPRGVLRIQGKTTYPVWIKPDWAFIEDGLPVPAVHSNLRYEYGVLGDYALSLGQGYLIHGTLYQRFLGLPVTHGCIRLGDDDLKEVYRTLNINSKVYIY